MDNAFFFIPDACWYEAPRERTPQFFATYSQVSIALQEALREAVLTHWMAEPGLLEDPQLSWPLLVYAASPIFRPKTRTEFNWDVLHVPGMQSFFRQAQRNLPALLERVQGVLRETRREGALNYRPDHASKILDTVKGQRGLRMLLQRAVVSEAKLLNELMRFSTVSREPLRVRAKLTAEIVKNWGNILSRFYTAQDFSPLAQQLMEVATRAFVASRETPPIETSDEIFENAPQEIAA